MCEPQGLTIKMQRRNSATPSVETGNQTPSADHPVEQQEVGVLRFEAQVLLHQCRGTRKICRGRLISRFDAWSCGISSLHLDRQSLWLTHVAGGPQTLQANSGKIVAMARARKAKSALRARDELTVSHHERLVEELRADPKLAAAYLNVAAKDGAARGYRAAVG